MLRAYALHRPLSVFLALGSVMFLFGLLPIARFLYFAYEGNSAGHVQSLILGCTLTIMGASAWIVGMLADLIAANRKLLEMTLEKVRILELGLLHQGDATDTRQKSGSTRECGDIEEEILTQLKSLPLDSQIPSGLKVATFDSEQGE